jgi:hypothetical protein
MKDFKRAQLRITYTILYNCGLRINEIRHLNHYVSFTYNYTLHLTKITIKFV